MAQVPPINLEDWEPVSVKQVRTIGTITAVKFEAKHVVTGELRDLDFILSLSTDKKPELHLYETGLPENFPKRFQMFYDLSVEAFEISKFADEEIEKEDKD